MVQIPTYQAQQGLAAPQYPTPRVDDSVGQALRSVGSAISSAAAEYKAHNDKMAAYKTNLAIEQWGNQQDVQFQTDLDGSAPDGSDFVATREKGLTESFKKLRSTIKDPELAAKADLIFERYRGSQVLKGMEAAKDKGRSYVLATTKDSVDAELRGPLAIPADALADADSFNTYFDKAIKPRIDSVISDPLKRQEAYGLFGKQLRYAYFQKHPEAAMPKGGGARIGITTGTQPGRQPLDMSGLKKDIVDKWERVQGAFGKAVPIVSAFRDPQRNARAGGAKGSQHLHGNAIDVDVSGLSHAERNRLLETASAMGFTGIGVYNNSLHFDTGNRRAWGPTHHSDSVPAWAFKTISKHLIGTTKAPESVQVASADNASVPQMPQGGIFQDMDPSEWQTRVNAAGRADDERIRLENAARVQQADETVKAGYDMVFVDGVTADWIEQNREQLSPTEYRYFNEALKRQNEEQKTDSGDYTAILGRALKDDDQAAVQDDAFASFAAGRMSKTDFNRIVTASRRTIAAKTDKPWLSDIRQALSSRLAPLDREDTDQYAKRLDGLFALDDWVAENPNATRDEVRKQSDALAARYSGDAVADLRAGLDLPKYSGVARYAINGDSLSVAAQKLAAAYREGKVNAEELNRETALLRRWKAVIDEEARSGPKR